jgi:hypothetical protein
MSSRDGAKKKGRKRKKKKKRKKAPRVSSNKGEVNILRGEKHFNFKNPFGKSKHGSTFVLSQISCIASCLALVEDEQKFNLGGCVGAHKTLISCANMPSECIK